MSFLPFALALVAVGPVFSGRPALASFSLVLAVAITRRFLGEHHFVHVPVLIGFALATAAMIEHVVLWRARDWLDDTPSLLRGSAKGLWTFASLLVLTTLTQDSSLPYAPMGWLLAAGAAALATALFAQAWSRSRGMLLALDPGARVAQERPGPADAVRAMQVVALGESREGLFGRAGPAATGNAGHLRAVLRRARLPPGRGNGLLRAFPERHRPALRPVADAPRRADRGDGRDLLLAMIQVIPVVGIISLPAICLVNYVIDRSAVRLQLRRAALAPA